MISFTQPTPLRDAVDSVSTRTPLGTALRTRELDRLPAEIKRRAFFSAAVEEKRLLKEMQNAILRRLRLERRVLADGSEGTFQRRDQFVREMQALAERYGVRPDDSRRGGLQDIGSFRRLRLIWDVQTKMAQGFSRYTSEHTDAALDRAPAYELIRKEARQVPRDWLNIFRDAIGDLGEQTRAIITPGNRMMAPKGDRIWRFISRFNQPWEPFDFNSGMGLRNVRRRLAEELGVIEPGEQISVEELSFNDGLEASTQGLDVGDLEDLRSSLGENVFFRSNKIVWNSDLDRGSDRGLNLTEELEQKAATVSTRVQQSLADASVLGSRSNVAGISAVATGRKVLHVQEIGRDADRAAQALAGALSNREEIRVVNGVLFVYRSDLNGRSFDDVIADYFSGGARSLLGFGASPGAEGSQAVDVRDDAGSSLLRFFAPGRLANIFGRARALDFSQALGGNFTFNVEGGAR